MQNRPWLSKYPAGIPANIEIPNYNSLNEFIQNCLTKYKKDNAFQCFGENITYGKLDKLSSNFGAYLQSRGLVQGDRIALMMPNLLQYPIALFGALKAGLIIVNTNPLYTGREMLHQFNDSQVKAIVIAENFAANLAEIIGDTSIDVVITTTIGEMLGFAKSKLVDFTVKYIKGAIKKYQLDNTVSFSEALSQGKKFKLKELEQSLDDVIIHQYTGGTTGVSKGAMLTNKNMLANMMQIVEWKKGVLKERSEVALSPLPMYHIFAFTVNCLAMMHFGTLSVLVTNPRDLDSIVKEFKRNDISLMTGVNTLFNALVHHKAFTELDFSSLRITVGGGMAVQPIVAEKWQQVTGCQLAEGYGMTEASPVVSVNPLDGSAKMGTIGLPVPSTDIRIMKEDGTDVQVGEPGELLVKGPQVMKGYYQKPEETAHCLRDGWLYTGDIACMDEEGFFKIVDRKKDMILVSGFNVFPNEIESLVARHPKVLEAAAIGVPDDKSGEVVKIFVVKSDKSLKEDELIQYCRENLTGYKVPKIVEFRKELPKSNVGKILRRMLRE